MAQSLSGRAARLLVSPAPRTLTHSLSILQHLQAFGEVTSFLNPRYLPRQPGTSDCGPTTNSTATILAIFSSPDALQNALKTPVTTVLSGHDYPDPKEEDPFNIRGLQDRIPPTQQSFRVEISPDRDPDNHHASLVKSNPFSGPFSLDRSAPVYADLKQSGAPLEGLCNIRTSSTTAVTRLDQPSPDPSPTSLKHLVRQRSGHPPTLSPDTPPPIPPAAGQQSPPKERKNLRRAERRRETEARARQLRREARELLRVVPRGDSKG